MKKRGLLLATTPLSHDGLTKIELDVIAYSKSLIEFDLACGFGITNEFADILNNKTVRFHTLPLKKKVLAYFFAIYKLVRDSKYDFVYIHGNSAMMILEALPSKIAGTKVITHCHNTKSNYPVVHYLVKPLFNYVVDVKIGCSSLASKWAYLGKRIRTIPNGVEIEKFRFSKTDRADIRKQIACKEDVLIGHIGRFANQKNHERLIDVFHSFHSEVPNSKLLLIGDGELFTSIQDKVRQRNLLDYVIFVKYTDTPWKYMSAMDVMVMPSLFEGLCLVALEAQANNLPILMDNNFAIETLATENAYSISLDASDSVWSQKILEILHTGRRNCCEQLGEKHLDSASMMQSIRDCLL